MPVNEGIFSPKSTAYLHAIKAKLASMEPKQIAEHIRGLVQQHDRWRRQHCLNLTAAENVISESALRLLVSHLATRAAEGPPGDREFPPAPQNRFIDEIEAILAQLVGQLFGAKYVEWRTTSNTMANAVALFALTDPGDLIMVQSLRAGANWSYHEDAIPKLRQLQVEEIPPSKDYGIDLLALGDAIRRKRPKLFIVGGSIFLFPYPLRELRDIANAVGARILYDAAHVGPLIAGGVFQQPLKEGADVVTLGTHKMMGGPVGGLVLCNDVEVAQRILHLTFPAFLQTRDQNKFASEAWSIAEMLQFSNEYSRQIVRNARALGSALEQEGFAVLFRDRGYTATHQLMLDVREHGAVEVEARCQQCNILLHKARLPGETRESPRGGIRIGVQELTRQGMREPEMAVVASFIRRAAIDRAPSERLISQIEEFLAAFGEILFSFDASGASKAKLVS